MVGPILFGAAFLVYFCAGAMPFAYALLGGGVVLAVLAVAACFKPGLTMPSRAAAYWLLLLGWPLVLLSSFAFTPVTYEGLQVFMGLLALPMGLFILAAFAPDAYKTQQMIHGFIGVMALQAVWLVVQFVFWPKAYGLTASHPAVTPHAAAMLCCMALCMAVTKLGQAAGQGRTIYIWGGISATLLAGMWAANVQIPQLVALIACVILAVQSMLQAGRLQKRFLLLAVAAFGSAYGLDWIAPFGMSAELGLLQETTPWAQRFMIWQESVQAALHKPITGVGLAQYSDAVAMFRLEENRTAGLSAHNDLLQLWVELGGLGPVCVVGACMAMAVFVVRHFHAQQTTAFLAYLLALGGVLAVSFTSSMVYDPSVLLACALFMHGVFLAHPTPTLVPHMVKQVLAALLLVGAVFIHGLGVYISTKSGQFQQALEHGKPDTAMAVLNDLIANTFDLQVSPYVLRAALALGMADTMNPSETLRPKLLEMAAADALHALSLSPYAAEAVFQQAQLARLAQDAGRETALLRQALQVNPGHMPSRMRLATLLAEQGHKDESYAVLRTARWWNSRQYPLWDLGQTVLWQAWQRGDKDAVKAALTTMAANIDVADIARYRRPLIVTP